MWRWLSAIIIACSLLLGVILIFGWLLQNNAQQTTDLVEQLNADKTAPQINNTQPLIVELSTEFEAQHQAIINNLTCINDSQCLVVAKPELSGHCLIAVNTIGAAKLAKLTNEKSPAVSANCLTRLRQTKAFCRQNQCSF